MVFNYQPHPALREDAELDEALNEEVKAKAHELAAELTAELNLQLQAAQMTVVELRAALAALAQAIV